MWKKEEDETGNKLESVHLFTSSFSIFSFYLLVITSVPSDQKESEKELSVGGGGTSV